MDRSAPSIDAGLLAFELLIDGEEMLDLTADVGEDLVHCVDLIVAGITSRYRQDLLVALFGIHHVQDADRPNLDEATRETRLGDEDEHIERIVVFGESSRDESVVTGVVHRRV